MPMQEKWIMENFDRLDVKVFLPVGAAFDYISGNVRRAPRWMTDHGLEWLGRLDHRTTPVVEALFNWQSAFLLPCIETKIRSA